MSEVANSEANSSEKPVLECDEVMFPPFPEPADNDFDDDITEEEKNFYIEKYSDLNAVIKSRLHCSACDRHLGAAAKYEVRLRCHPMLRTLVCQPCHTFYNSGEFEKGDDGSELYCRWCGQGGQVYCCADCQHVFCAKCIKRNLGPSKIKEIESNDDWKCFKCNNRCLWDLRAKCWALLRYCDLKNKLAAATTDNELKAKLLKDCEKDYSDCCKNKSKRKEKVVKKDAENAKKDAEIKKVATAIAAKIPPTIQVKKFASINHEETKQEKKAQKRSASPKMKTGVYVKNSMLMSPGPRMINPIAILPKRPKMTSTPKILAVNNVRFSNDKKVVNTYGRIRPRATFMPVQFPILQQIPYNGYNSDNINLSIESLTQGLDMNAVVGFANAAQNDDLVCTPDLPLEPVCEVTEDNNDDDVECITPGPVAPPKISSPPPLIPRSSALPDLSNDNVIQMTENDVTVNTVTGGLKFRVDPQTLSSNKMYRLPDGRIFAINANPNMPGGYSATIVALADNNAARIAPKGATYAAKLSAITAPRISTPPPLKTTSSSPGARKYKQKSNSNALQSPAQQSNPSKVTFRECDFNVPVEWFRYNLIDAVDALEYSLPKLVKMKKEASTMYLRTRSLDEMRSLYRSLERQLNTASTRFKEIRDNLSKDWKQFVMRKMGSDSNISDDDDVEILPGDDNDDPIFIDENSMDSTRVNDNNDIDLTGQHSSEQNDSSTEKILNKGDITENLSKSIEEVIPDAESTIKINEIYQTEDKNPEESARNVDETKNDEDKCCSSGIPETNNKEDTLIEKEMENNDETLNTINTEQKVIPNGDEKSDDKQVEETSPTKDDDQHDEIIKKEKEPINDCDSNDVSMNDNDDETNEVSQINKADSTEKIDIVKNEINEDLIDKLLYSDEDGDNLKGSQNVNSMDVDDIV